MGIRAVLGCVWVSSFGLSLSFAMAQSAGGGGADGGAGGGSPGANAPAVPIAEPEFDSSDPLRDYFRWKRDIADQYGLKIGLQWNLTSQFVVHGPETPSRHVARYDLGINQQLWQNAEVDLVVRGGWGDGPDPVLGNTVNTNQYAQTNSDAFVLHLWLKQRLLDDQLTVIFGKMDVGDWIDVNRFGYYNFVGFSLNHNPAIPFPGNPLAAMVTYAPKEVPWLYVQGGVANAAQSSYVAGFEELFDGDTALFAIGEVGFKTKLFGQDGVYRFIGWYDGRDLPEIGSGDSSDDRAGFAVSFDQNVTESFGLFFKYGISGQSEFNPQQSWSAGFLWTGPIAARPRDSLGVGVVQNIFANERDNTVINHASNAETYIETYYNVEVYEWLQVKPFVQVITDPGGGSRSTEVTLGFHVALTF